MRGVFPKIHTHENPTNNEVFDGMNAGCNQQMMKYAVKVCACVYEWLNLYSSTPSILLFKSLGVCACTVHFLFRLPMPRDGVCILSVCCVFVVITHWMRNIWQHKEHKEHNDVLFPFVNIWNEWPAIELKQTNREKKHTYTQNKTKQIISDIC